MVPQSSCVPFVKLKEYYFLWVNDPIPLPCLQALIFCLLCDPFSCWGCPLIFFFRFIEIFITVSFHQLFCLLSQFDVHILSWSHYFNQSLLVLSRTSIRILFLTSVSSFRSLFMFSLNSSSSLNLFIIALLNSVSHILCKFFLLGNVAMGSLGRRTVLVFMLLFFLRWDLDTWS